MFSFTAFADDERNVPQNLILSLCRLENIVGKGENAGNFSYKVFKSFFFFYSNIIEDCDLVVKG